MKQIYVECQNPLYSIPLGRQGENLAVQIVFNCASFAEQYGEGTAELVHKQANTELLYPVNIEQDSNMLRWTITNADTAQVGVGQAELRWYSGNTLAKSVIYRTSVSAALEGTETEEVPPPQQAWVDKILETAAEIKDDVLTEEELEAAVAAYLEKNPIESGITEEEARRIAQNVLNEYLASKQTDTQITEAILTYSDYTYSLDRSYVELLDLVNKQYPVRIRWAEGADNEHIYSLTGLYSKSGSPCMIWHCENQESFEDIIVCDTDEVIRMTGTNVTAESLSSAIDLALAQAKESGEFDGSDGTDGIGIASIVQTTTSAADGGSNVVTVTLTNGEKSTFSVKNGSRGSAGAAGSNGADGYTPVRGTDYWTAADKTEIINAVLDALPAAEEAAF